MKPYLNLMAQLIGIIVCTGLTKTQTLLTNTVNLPGVAIWCGLSSRELIGSYYFEETVTGQTHLKMLKSWFHVLIISLEMKKRFTSNKTGCIWLSYQCEKFSRSHNQSEMDSTKEKCYGVPALISRFWGTLKNTVYATKSQTLKELRHQTEHAINDIPLATIQTVCRSVRRRCWEYTVAECGHFEHIRA